MNILKKVFESIEAYFTKPIVNQTPPVTKKKRTAKPKK